MADGRKDSIMKPTKTITMPRDAKSGRIVSPGYAKTHPSTTTVEHRVVPAAPPAGPKKK